MDHTTVRVDPSQRTLNQPTEGDAVSYTVNAKKSPVISHSKGHQMDEYDFDIS